MTAARIVGIPGFTGLGSRQPDWLPARAASIRFGARTLGRPGHLVPDPEASTPLMRWRCQRRTVDSQRSEQGTSRRESATSAARHDSCFSMGDEAVDVRFNEFESALVEGVFDLLHVWTYSSSLIKGEILAFPD